MISELVIDSKFQGKGYGTKAIKFIEKIAKKTNSKKIVMLVNTREKAVKLYKKLGYSATAYELFAKKVN